MNAALELMDQLRTALRERDEARDALFRADQGALRVEEERDRLQRERDEARAELAGLPAWQKGCEQALGDLADAEEAIARLYTERDEARAKLEQCEKEKNGYARRLDALQAAIADALVKRIKPRLSRHPVTVVQHAGSVIERIGREMGSEYEDGDDLVECVRLLVRECAALRERCETLANNHEWRVEEMAALRKERDEHKAKREEYAAEARSLRERLKDAYRERDEARTEVERLRAEAASSLAMARIAGDKHDQKCAEVDVLRGVGCEEDGDGSCGVCRKCAYRRGAEAMREACARKASVCANHRGEELDAILSALPIPEDK